MNRKKMKILKKKKQKNFKIENNIKHKVYKIVQLRKQIIKITNKVCKTAQTNKTRMIYTKLEK